MKTIFLIDDDDDDREIFQEALNSLNMDVALEQAVNGMDAFQKLNAAGFEKPDIIFLDLNMPIMDGKQFLVEIKKHAAFKDIPVIIYSTSSNTTDVNFALQNDASKFITKHYSIARLCEELKDTLREF